MQSKYAFIGIGPSDTKVIFDVRDVTSITEHPDRETCGIPVPADTQVNLSNGTCRILIGGQAAAIMQFIKSAELAYDHRDVYVRPFVDAAYVTCPHCEHEIDVPTEDSGREEVSNDT